MKKMNRVRVRTGVKSTRNASRGRGAAGAVAVVLASSAVALAGCGGSSSSNSTGSSAAGSGGTPASSQTESSTKAARFSQCMRAHGVPDFPDPNANGSITVKVTKGSDLDPQSPTYESALQSCKSLEPAGFGSGSAQSLGNQNKMLQFVGCMRKNGVPNFPDPNANGAELITGGQGINPNSPQFKSALQTCHKLLPGGGTGAAVGG
jgi:hypothetical protein